MIKSRIFQRHHAIFFLILLIGFFLRLLPARNLEGKLIGLDPYLFFKWANFIEKKGYLPEIDYYQYFPIGNDVKAENWIISFFLYFLGKMMGSLYLAAVFYPPLMFLLGSFILACGFRRIFGSKATYVLCLSLSLLPSFLFRLSAGFSDKEPLAYFFFSLSVYCFLRYLEKRENYWAFYSGVFLGLMMSAWGGFQFLLVSYSLTTFLLIREKDVRKFFLVMAAGFLPFFLFTHKYKLLSFSIKSYYGLAFWFSIFASFLIEILRKMNIDIKRKVWKINIDTFDIVLICVALLGILIFSKEITRIINVVFITPYGGNRFALSVAENQPPYFEEWVGHLSYLFLIVILLLPIALLDIVKDKKVVAMFFISFLLLLFSRYSPYVGENILSKFYWIFVVISFVIFYYYLKNEKVECWKVFLLSFFFLSAIGARSAMRVFFVFSIPLSLFLSYISKKILDYSRNIGKNFEKLVLIGMLLVIATLLKGDYLTQTRGIVPTFSDVWLETYRWIKNSTSPYDIVSHWWDYGYWTHFYADRFTPVDGGNRYYVRNFYNARFFFCSKNASEFLKAMEMLGYPDYILITSREPFVFYQIARIGYVDTWIGLYVPQDSFYVGRAIRELEEDYTEGNLTFFRGTKIIGVNVTTDGYYAILFTPEKKRMFHQVKIGCICEPGVGCIFREGVGECITIYPGFLLTFPKRILNTTFIQTYILSRDLPWFKRVYDNWAFSFENGKIVKEKELSLISLLNERNPDLKVYKVDYKELVKYV